MTDKVERTIRRLDEMTILEREDNEELGIEDRQVTEIVLWQAVDEGLDDYFERKRRAGLKIVREELAKLSQ